jgi:hypothetical protein
LAAKDFEFLTSFNGWPKPRLHSLASMQNDLWFSEQMIVGSNLARVQVL